MNGSFSSHKSSAGFADGKTLPNHPQTGGISHPNNPARPPLGKEKGDMLVLMILLLLLWEGGEGSRGTILTLLFFLLL